MAPCGCLFVEIVLTRQFQEWEEFIICDWTKDEMDRFFHSWCRKSAKNAQNSLMLTEMQYSVLFLSTFLGD